MTRTIATATEHEHSTSMPPPVGLLDSPDALRNPLLSRNGSTKPKTNHAESEKYHSLLAAQADDDRTTPWPARAAAEEGVSREQAMVPPGQAAQRDLRQASNVCPRVSVCDCCAAPCFRRSSGACLAFTAVTGGASAALAFAHSTGTAMALPAVVGSGAAAGITLACGCIQLCGSNVVERQLASIQNQVEHNGVVLQDTFDATQINGVVIQENGVAIDENGAAIEENRYLNREEHQTTRTTVKGLHGDIIKMPQEIIGLLLEHRGEFMEMLGNTMVVSCDSGEAELIFEMIKRDGLAGLARFLKDKETANQTVKQKLHDDHEELQDALQKQIEGQALAMEEEVQKIKHQLSRNGFRLLHDALAVDVRGAFDAWKLLPDTLPEHREQNSCPTHCSSMCNVM